MGARQSRKELSLREQELKLKQQEEKSREEAQKSSLWSPLGVALIAAILGLLGNIAVSFLQGNANRKLAKEKATFDESIEHFKAQSNLILEAIKVGPETAKKNLQFFIEVELIDEPLRERIQNWLLVNESPSLSPTIEGAINVTLIDEDNKPIENATVEIMPAYLLSVTIAAGQTDNNGRFAARCLPGSYSISVRAEGYQSTQMVLVLEPQTTHNISLTLRALQ